MTTLLLVFVTLRVVAATVSIEVSGEESGLWVLNPPLLLLLVPRMEPPPPPCPGLFPSHSPFPWTLSLTAVTAPVHVSTRMRPGALWDGQLRVGGGEHPGRCPPSQGPLQGSHRELGVGVRPR